MDHKFKSKLRHFAMFNIDDDNLIESTIKHIEGLESEIKDLKEKSESLEGKLIRKKVRQYNGQSFEGE